MFTLMIIVLLSSGQTYDMASREFPSKDRCEGYRDSVIVQANKQANPWLISSCEGPTEPVTLKIFFLEKPEPAGDKS